VVVRPSSQNLLGLMHNKVIIVDADVEDANKPIIITGSTNFSVGQIQEDPNEIIVIQDQTLAKAYALEMDELMAGIFGSNKTQNTPINFKIGGSDLELYFSPTNDIETAMEKVIGSADDELFFAIFAFTRRNIAYAINSAISAGVYAAGVMDGFIDMAGDDPFEILNETMVVPGTLVEDGGGPIMHHKYMIVDPNNPSSDPTVITGSTNWSTNGFSRSEENMIIFHDAEVANIYYQSFAQRYATYGGAGALAVEDIELNNSIRVYPNPVGEQLFFNMEATDVKEISLQLFDLKGQELLNRTFPAQVGNTLYYADLPSLSAGMYIVNINGKTSQLIVK